VVNASAGRPKREVAPGEPAVIRRLPEGVDYTLIKTIFVDLPSGLPTLLWAARWDSNPLLRAFNYRTVRAIIRALRRAEKSETSGELIAGVRRELVQLCLQELHSPWSPHPDLAISDTLVLPQHFRDGHKPPGPPVQHLRITVSRTVRPQPTDPFASATEIVEQRFLTAGPAPWDPAIPFIDPDQRDRIIMELVHKHCPRLLSVRPSGRWRSNYPPEGWRLITQHIVPRLYEYLRPFYPVRRHRRAGRNGPGRYSAQLRRDITEIVRLEMRGLADKLTPERVTAAIQRHVASRHSKRNSTRRKRPKQ
jgi:hypothetical protein